MSIVYIPGCWDLLHIGHLTILERAKGLGDTLIVGIASDDVIRQDKKESPVIPLADRLRILTALKCVDLALPYYRLEFLTHLQMIEPDILVIGETWGSEQRHKDVYQWVKDNEKRIVMLPYSAEESTTNIKKRIKQCNLTSS